MKSLCGVTYCERVATSKGLCGKHYMRLRDTGSLVKKSLETRFWEKVNKTDTCWFWTGYINSKGYGRAYLKGDKHIGAYRVAYEYVKGKVPKGLVLDHLCRVPSCVNPDHLEPVTYRENTTRGLLVLNKKNGLPVGVHKAGKRYKSYTTSKNKRYYLGTYDTPEEAHQAYLEKLNTFITVY